MFLQIVMTTFKLNRENVSDCYLFKLLSFRSRVVNFVDVKFFNDEKIVIQSSSTIVAVPRSSPGVTFIYERTLNLYESWQFVDIAGTRHIPEKCDVINGDFLSRLTLSVTWKRHSDNKAQTYKVKRPNRSLLSFSYQSHACQIWMTLFVKILVSIKKTMVWFLLCLQNNTL